LVCNTEKLAVFAEGPPKKLRRALFVGGLAFVASVILLLAWSTRKASQSFDVEECFRMLRSGQPQKEVEQLLVRPGTILSCEQKESLAATCGTPKDVTAYWEMWDILHGRLFVAFDERKNVSGVEVQLVGKYPIYMQFLDWLNSKWFGLIAL
jgi:hypothetical protein